MSEEEKKKKKKGLLPRTEMIILIVLLSFFVLWAFKQCSDSIIDPSIEEETPVVTDTVGLLKEESITKEPDTVKIVTEVTVLYVNIDKLKLRESPDLKGELLEELSLGEKVMFDGEVTDSLYTLNLGRVEVTEPWVKVKTWKGRTGWVYGAGVDYYRRKVNGTY